MSRLLAVVLPLMLSTNAWAEKSAVAVLDIAGTGVDPGLLPTLTEILTVEIDALGTYKVIAGRDVQAMLGFEKQKEIVGCTDAACLAEIGGALGVDRVVASHIGMVGSTYVVNIKLINIRMADTEARVYETVRGEQDALIATIKKSVNKLLGAGSKAGSTLAAASAPAPAPTPAAKEPPKTVVATVKAPAPAPKEPEQVAAATEPPAKVETKVSGDRNIGWAPVTLWVVGGLGIAGGVVAGFTAKGKEADANTAAGDPYPQGTLAVGAQKAAEEAKTFALISTIAYAVGGAAVAGGVLAWLLSGSSEEGKTAVAPLIGTDSVGLAVSGRF